MHGLYGGAVHAAVSKRVVQHVLLQSKDAYNAKDRPQAKKVMQPYLGLLDASLFATLPAKETRLLLTPDTSTDSSSVPFFFLSLPTLCFDVPDFPWFC